MNNMDVSTMDPAQLAAYVNGLVQEAEQERGLYVQDAERCLKLFNDGCDDGWGGTSAGLPELVINQIRPAVLGMLGQAVSRKLRGEFKARVAEDPPTVWLTEAGAEKVRRLTGAVPSDGLSEPTVPGDSSMGPSAISADVPLTPQQQGLVQSLLAESIRGAAAGAVVSADALSPDDVVKVGDQEAAQTVQTMVDLKLDAADSNVFLYRHFFGAGVQGWDCMMTQWEAGAKKPRLLPIPIKNAWIDPLADSIERAAYVIIDAVMDARQAKALYPMLEEAIDRFATTGMSPSGGAIWSNRYTKAFRRGMIPLRLAWIRDHPYPLSPDAALAGGHIRSQRDFTTSDGAPYTGDVQQAQDGSHWSGQVIDAQSVPLTAGDPYFVRSDTGATVTPPSGDQESPGWPMRMGTRQLVILFDRVVEDGESPWFIDGQSDIPVLWTPWLPRLGGPYGIGEPLGLAGMQDGINRIADASVRHTIFSGNGERVFPMSIRRDLEKSGAAGNVGRKAGRNYFAEDELYKATDGKIGNYIEPPPLAPQAMEILKFLIEQIRQTAGWTQALQGNPDYTGQSGAAIAALQNAAMGPMAVKVRHMENSIIRLYKLMAEAVVRFLDPQDWAKVLSVNGENVALAFAARIKNLSLDVAVDLGVGDNNQRQLTRDQTLGYYQAGLIDRQTAQEQLDLKSDPATNERINMERAGPAASAANPALQGSGVPTPSQPVSA